MNELVDLAKKINKYCLIFNVDFEKACDSVSWFFLHYMLSRLGFNDNLRGWMHACVFYINLAVLVNGCSTQ